MKITFDRWDGGLDKRAGASTGDANRLQSLTNAYVTTAKKVRKRPGLTKVATLPAASHGLFSALGKLQMFQLNTADAVSNPSLLQNNAVSFLPGLGAQGISKVLDVRTYAGKMYVAIQHLVQSGFSYLTYAHHYFDGGTSTVVLRPGQNFTVTGSALWAQFAVIAGRVYVVDGEDVKYCSLYDPANQSTSGVRDWTTTGDAGFLPISMNAHGSKTIVALGTYQNKLVVFLEDSAQIWAVDADPNLNTLSQTIDLGALGSAACVANMAGDVLFQSPAGIRSITNRSQTDNLIDSDIGAPIDNVLKSIIDNTTARGIYLSSQGQYWVFSGLRAAVFTFSRTSKIAAWSLYKFTTPLDHIAELGGVVYIRSGNDLFKLDADAGSDNGSPIQVEISTVYADFKSPGDLKQITGMDLVCEGECDVTHRYDPRSDPTDYLAETNPPVHFGGDSRPGALMPVELVTTNLATIIRTTSNAPFELQSITYYFENLGNV